MRRAVELSARLTSHPSDGGDQDCGSLPQPNDRGNSVRTETNGPQSLRGAQLSDVVAQPLSSTFAIALECGN